jgi:DNA (cytosine-5)-methyltransferase 1
VSELTHLSLFSGIGGIDLAAEWAGFRTVAFVERNPFNQEVLRKHWTEVPIIDDVRKVTTDVLKANGIARVDLLSGGFPCQPFSTAGLRKGGDDDRYLWPEMARVIREINPRWVLGENVPGIRTNDSGRVFGTVVADLAQMGYRVGWSSYGTDSIGGTQPRERVFIVAYTHGGRREERHSESGCVQQRDQGYLPSAPSTAKSRLGGNLDGLPDRVDDARWPAGPEEAQYEWEPSRTGEGIVDRRSRLIALGNAVNPYQVYPLLRAIAKTF